MRRTLVEDLFERERREHNWRRRGRISARSPRKCDRLGRELEAIGCRYLVARFAAVQAGPSKARRRGLRRTTSALTTAVLGAVLTASIFAAQQSASPDNGSQAQTAAPVREAAPATASAPLWGMSATRGPRYLLRNGLDYLSYQQYDRALKFLREAETHQKEFNDAEKLALKQGIESAPGAACAMPPMQRLPML